jgi:hypothetical protein
MAVAGSTRRSGHYGSVANCHRPVGWDAGGTWLITTDQSSPVAIFIAYLFTDEAFRGRLAVSTLYLFILSSFRVFDLPVPHGKVPDPVNALAMCRW